MKNPDEEILQAASLCVHCGLCLPSCPTYRETGDEGHSPRGRIYLMRALADGRLAPGEGVNEYLDACVGCRACESACPAGVRYGSLLELSRAQFVEPSRTPGLRTRFWRPMLRTVLPHPARLAAAALPARAAKKLLARHGRVAGWLPAPIRRSLEVMPDARWPQSLPEWTPAVGPERGVVAVLSGCAMPSLYPEANAATVRMLARAGYRVWVPREQGCCGAIHAHDGDREGAKALARRNIEAFEHVGPTAIIANAAGCGAALKDYGHLLAGDSAWQPRAEALAAKARDFSEWLAEVGVPAPEQPFEGLVTYHDPCHLAHGQKIKDAPRRLLRAMPGLRFVELPESDWCCGGAGSYTLLQPEMSDRLLAHKLRHIGETGADVVVTANAPCLMQIGMGLAREGRSTRLVHLAEFLDSLYA